MLRNEANQAKKDSSKFQKQDISKLSLKKEVSFPASSVSPRFASSTKSINIQLAPPTVSTIDLNQDCKGEVSKNNSSVNFIEEP